MCTLLVDLQPADVTEPLAQFQATKAVKDDLLQLLKNLNKGLQEAAMSGVHIEKAFQMWWPELEKELKNLPPGEPAQSPRREDRELLEELVDLARAAKGDSQEMHLLERLFDTTTKLSDQVREAAQRLKLLMPITLPADWSMAVAPILGGTSETLAQQTRDPAAYGKLIEAARLWPKDPEQAFSDFQRAADSLSRYG